MLDSICPWSDGRRLRLPHGDQARGCHPRHGPVDRRDRREGPTSVQATPLPSGRKSPWP